MSIAEREVAGAARRREDWLRAIEALFAHVEQWAAEGLVAGDASPSSTVMLEKTEKEIVDEWARGTYVVPVLRIGNIQLRGPQKAREEYLVLEPIMYNSVTGTGRVDFYAWPAMYRVRLLQEMPTGLWTVKTDSGLNWPLPWGEKTFVQIAEGLLDA